MPIKPFQAAREGIERVTHEHYERHAESFWLGTRDHDVSHYIEAILQALPQDTALDILEQQPWLAIVSQRQNAKA